MLSNTLDRISFFALLLVVVLLPIFFLPFTKIPIETSKGLLLVVGLTISLIFWLVARLREGRIILPKSLALVMGLGIVLASLASALFSSIPKVSFFGTMFDIGSFWFIFSCFLLMFTCSVVLKDSKSAKLVLFWTITSFVVVLIFQCLHYLMPQALSFGVLGSKSDNVLGSMNSLGFFAGFVGLMSLFVLEFFSISKNAKWVLGVLMVLCLGLIAIVNFSTIWMLLGVFALLILILKVSFFSGFQQGAEANKRFPTFSLAVVMISFLFLLSGQFLGVFLADRLGISNTEVSPSFSATKSISKSVLSKDPIFGIGPNRFGEAWALYKPISVNTGPFWNVYFESGFGLLPTLALTTGIFGMLMWLLFFIFLISTGLKSVFSNPGSQMNFELTVLFIAVLYFFSASFVYSVGAVIFLLAFAFAGVFIGLSSNRPGGQVAITFQNNPKKSFFFVFLIVLLMILLAGVGFKYLQRFASIPYYGKALSAQTIPLAESSIQKAISLYQNDLYLRTYSQVYLIKFNSLLGQASGGASASDEDRTNLQRTLDQAINGAQRAINYNKENYLNFQTLGFVYETAGSFGVPEAFNKAIENYRTAATLNPLNPGLQLSIARVLFADKKAKEAKDYVIQALNLKPNYADAFVSLSQIIKNEGDNETALFYANKALSLEPDNKEVINYVNSLKK